MKYPTTISAANSAIQKGDLAPSELIEYTLGQISLWDSHLNAFLEVLAEEAVLKARALDQAKDKSGKLHGIPIAIKDIICTTEGHTTASSKILKDFHSPFDATAVKKLKAAGAIIIGKTNCDEFAMGASNEYSAYGPVKNPWDTKLVPGGSSGGSAAAVASGEVLAALGTDTGGSIRLPASFCNIVGVKPTYGRVSRFGAIAYASSFDQIGPLNRSVADAALLMEVLAGPDQLDATSSPYKAEQYTTACGRDLAGLVIGVPVEYFNDEVSQNIKQPVTTAIKHLQTLGAKVIEISLPTVMAAVPTYYLLVKSEASTNLGRYDSLRYGQADLKVNSLIEYYLETRGKNLGPEVKRSILMGTYALSAGYIDAWYKQASRVRTLIRRDFTSAFSKVDILAGPVAAELPWPIGKKIDDPLAMYLADLLTDPASVAGLPALSVPCGFSKGLPVGLQLIAPHFEEKRLFQVAHAYEQSTAWHKKSPELPET